MTQQKLAPPSEAVYTARRIGGGRRQDRSGGVKADVVVVAVAWMTMAPSSRVSTLRAPAFCDPLVQPLWIEFPVD